jgi:hypothetical protein
MGTTNREFIVRVRCGGRTYTETIWTIDAETAYGHHVRIERQYENDYGYRARTVGMREVK